jgi:hypothetical protein
LRRRWVDLYQDRLDLYRTRPTGKFSRSGHEQQYNNWQTNLRSLVQQARARGCPYNPEANLWLLRPVPRPWWMYLP